MSLDRRSFLAAAGASVLAPTLRASDSPAPFKISLAQWSLHQAFFAKKADPLKFAEIAKTEYGIEAVEYVNQFYKDKKADQAYPAELKKAADDQGVRSVLIMCDGEGNLGDPDAAKRKTAAGNHKRWAEWAKQLGCHSIRVNAYSQGSREEQQKLAADGLAQLNALAKPLEIGVIVENHGGFSSDGEWLAGVMKLVGDANVGTLPDFGNFRLGAGKEYDRYQGVDEMMPFAKGVSAKTHDFDADGNETHTDYRRMMKLVCQKHKYSGFVGIEYEGTKLSEPDGIRATKKLLEAVRTELAKG